MTRGKIIFIDEAGRHYQTLEFNGDMYPEGHGATVIDKYEDGEIQSYCDYERFAVSFDRRYFGYADSVDELLSVFLLKDDSVDYTKNWTDYLYVINGSGRVVKALAANGLVEIPAAEMAVFHYQEFKRLVQMKNAIGKTFPKKTFVEILSRLQETHDLKNDIDKLIQAKSDVTGNSFVEEAGMLICHENSVIELLEFIMNDQAGDIRHFVYEFDYGRSYKTEMAADIYGDDTAYRTAEALYDYLLKAMSKNNGELSDKM